MPEWRPIHRHIALGVLLVLIVGAIVALENVGRKSTVPPPPADIPAHLASFTSAPNFEGATGWINTDQPIDLVSLRGNVTLVDFWTYSCINCIRTFPYLNAWHDTYKDRGLTIIGVHSPEFRFERDRDNVMEATERHDIEHAVAQDNDFSIWKAYHNRYWPAKYLVDQYGKIRYTHFGEGDYAGTEHQIRLLLQEAGHDPGPTSGIAERETSGGRTPELYAGGSRASIGNPEGYHPGETITYVKPSQLAADRIYLSGTWYNDDENLRAESGATIFVKFHGAGGNFVAGGADGRCASAFLDDQTFPPDRAGQDVSYEGGIACIRLDGARSYDFYGGPNEAHLLELRVPDGFELFTFAFSSSPTNEG
ncbi:MAG TPA: thioredoxin family protein [Candidatus Thermoplasmatota archaeon]